MTGQLAYSQTGHFGLLLTQMCDVEKFRHTDMVITLLRWESAKSAKIGAFKPTHYL